MLMLRNDADNPFPKHIVPHDFVAFLRSHTRIPAAYAAMGCVLSQLSNFASNRNAALPLVHNAP